MKPSNRIDLENGIPAKIQDAEALFEKDRYQCAIYICGYAVEMALKVRMCELIGWKPEHE